MDQLCKDMTVNILPLYAILKACRYNIIIHVVHVYINTYCRCNVHKCSVDVDSINSTPSCHKQSITRKGPLHALPPSLQWWSPRPSWPGTDNNAPLHQAVRKATRKSADLLGEAVASTHLLSKATLLLLSCPLWIKLESYIFLISIQLQHIRR